MNRYIYPVVLSLLVITRASATEIQVSAAASLTDSLKEVGAAFEEKTGDKAAFNFAASSTLALQIQEGAPIDVFISADEAKMDMLEKQALILKETRKSLLSNTLVIVVADDSPLTFNGARDLADPRIKRIALAEPGSVPAGIYAKAYLLKIGLWQSVLDRVIPTENVRATLAAVASGNVDAGIVYQTDAKMSKHVRIAWEVPQEEGPKISYPAAVVASSTHVEHAKDFLAYLESDDAEAMFQRYGFMVRQ